MRFVILSRQRQRLVWAAMAAICATTFAYSASEPALLILALAVAWMPLFVCALARPTAYLDVRKDRIEIIAGPTALHILRKDILTPTIHIMDADPAQDHLQALAAVRLGGYRMGWHNNPGGSQRQFLASNGRNVLRFSTKSGIDVAVSLPWADLTRLACEIGHDENQAATKPDME